MHPLIPFTVRGDLDSPLILFQWNGELVSCKEVKGTLRKTIINFVQDSVLICGVKISGKLGQLLLPGREAPCSRNVQDLVRAIKFISVGGPSLGMVLRASSSYIGSSAAVPFHYVFWALRWVDWPDIMAKSLMGHMRGVVPFRVHRYWCKSMSGRRIG
jgi:hypothetical protein